MATCSKEEVVTIEYTIKVDHDGMDMLLEGLRLLARHAEFISAEKAAIDLLVVLERDQS